MEDYESELLDTPPELREPGQQALLDALRVSAPGVAAAQHRLESAIHAFQAASDPSPSPSLSARLAERVARDPRVETPPKPAAEPLLRRVWRAFLGPWMLVPAMAAAAALLWLRLAPVEPSVRTRGATVALAPSVSLRLIAERSAGGVETLGQGAVLEAGDRIVFRIQARSAARVVLMERAPGGGVSVVLDRPLTDAAAEVRVVDGSGAELSWAPDAGPGAYTYRALALPEGAAGSGPPEWAWAAEPGAQAQVDVIFEAGP